MRIRRALVPVLLATVATLTACGGGDSGGQAADDPTSASTEATEGGAAGDDGGDPAGDVAACDLLTTDEVAEATAFLALRAPPSMTGAVIDVNGASYVR